MTGVSRRARRRVRAALCHHWQSLPTATHARAWWLARTLEGADGEAKVGEANGRRLLAHRFPRATVVVTARDIPGVTDACARRCACEHEPRGHGRRDDDQGDIIPTIAMGQPSRMMRPSPLPSLGPLASARAERKGHMLKRHSSSQPGTTFARRSPKKAPRPRQARSSYGLLSTAKASQYGGNGVCEDAA